MYHSLTSLYWDTEQDSRVLCLGAASIAEHWDEWEAADEATGPVVTLIPKIGTDVNEHQ